MKVYIYNVNPAGIFKAAGFAEARRAGDYAAHLKRLPHLEYVKGWTEPPVYVLPHVARIIHDHEDDSVSFYGFGGMVLFKIDYCSYDHFEVY